MCSWNQDFEMFEWQFKKMQCGNSMVKQSLSILLCCYLVSSLSKLSAVLFLFIHLSCFCHHHLLSWSVCGELPFYYKDLSSRMDNKYIFSFDFFFILIIISLHLFSVSCVVQECIVVCVCWCRNHLSLPGLYCSRIDNKYFFSLFFIILSLSLSLSLHLPLFF